MIDLKSTAYGIKFNLNQAILDNAVINSPENISKLAREYLNTNLTTYKKSQIKNLNNKNQNFTEVSKVEKKKKERPGRPRETQGGPRSPGVPRAPGGAGGPGSPGGPGGMAPLKN